jgi:hypothetical protein
MRARSNCFESEMSRGRLIVIVMGVFGDLIRKLTNHGMRDLTCVRIAKNKHRFVRRNGVWQSPPSSHMRMAVHDCDWLSLSLLLL